MPRPRRLRVLGVGMGPQHLTPEVAQALRSVDYVLAAQKSEHDELLAVRREVSRAHGVPLVAVPDPERDRDDPRDYGRAVADWHDARVAAYERVLAERPGDVAFLVWGDPSLYDSTIRVAESLAARCARAGEELDWDVLPGVSAPQLLAARHRVVLHEVGAPVHVTTGRRLADDLAAGQRNLVVMLGSEPPPDWLDGLDDWRIWWGANLGTPSEQLVAGRVGDVREAVVDARARARRTAGWVMDVYLLRAGGAR